MVFDIERCLGSTTVPVFSVCLLYHPGAICQDGLFPTSTAVGSSFLGASSTSRVHPWPPSATPITTALRVAGCFRARRAVPEAHHAYVSTPALQHSSIRLDELPTINGVPQYPVQSQPHLHTASMELPSMLSLDGKDQSSPSRGLIHLQSTEKHPPSLFRSKITSLLRSNCFKSGQDCLTITDQPVWGGLRPLSNRLRTVNWLTDN